MIENEILYINGLGYADGHYADNGIKDILHLDTLTEALKPVINVGKLVKKGVQEIRPDEVELEIQLQLAISDKGIAFAIVNTTAEAHLSLKFKWKKEDIER